MSAESTSYDGPIGSIDSFQPAIQLLARANRNIFRDGLAKVHREIQAAGMPRFWLPEEYLGKTQLIALLLSPIYAYFFVGWLGGNGFTMTVIAVAATAFWLRASFSLRRSATPARH